MAELQISRDIGARNPGFSRVRWDRRVQVPVATLDRLIEIHGRPGFCMIDVEGHEAEVLAGLGQSVPALSVEFVAGALEVTRACVDRLEQLGDYRFDFVIGERREFQWREWRSADAVRQWLARGADGVASGDLYARLDVGRRAPSSCSSCNRFF